MKPAVIFLDGPIGVGKTSLARAAAMKLNLGFIDGDDHSAPGPWFRSILRTSHKIVAASLDALRDRPAVIVAYPLRCTNWVFFSKTFERHGVSCHCIGLLADVGAISARERVFDEEEIARSVEMIAQGYGRRTFSAAFLRTDEAGFDETCSRLQTQIQKLLTLGGENNRIST